MPQGVFCQHSVKPRTFNTVYLWTLCISSYTEGCIVLLALLYLGVKNIHLGPTLPGFLSPNVAKVLAEKFGLAGIGTVDSDIELFMAQ